MEAAEGRGARRDAGISRLLFCQCGGGEYRHSGTEREMRHGISSAEEPFLCCTIVARLCPCICIYRLLHSWIKPRSTQGI